MAQLVMHGLSRIGAARIGAARIGLSWVRIELVLLTGALILAG
jgi:hypothetical protein